MTTATGSAEEVPFVRGMERAVDEDEAEKIVSKFRLDGWITERIRGIWASMHQERGPADYAESDFERGMRAGARLPGHNYGGTHNGNGNGSRLLGWLMTLNIAATLALGGWILKTLSENTRDIAVIQCRLSPDCPNVAVREGRQ